MKQFFTKALRAILRKLAQFTVWRYRPGIVGITGSVGKTSTKLAIATVLGTVRRVRVSSGNLNNDFGLPLSILGEWSPRELKLVSRDTRAGTARPRKFFFWAKVLWKGVWQIVQKSPLYPEILVLEYGADRPGDIKYLLKIARPNVSVITAIGEMPVHVEYYAGPDEVAREKSRLIEQLSVGGFAVLNHDDETVMRLAARTRARLLSYGFTKGADVQITRFENRIDGDRPAGIAFKIDYTGNSVPTRIEGAFGKIHAYGAGAAAAVGLIFGMNLAKISEALAAYKPARSRMQIMRGMKGTWLIDDSYNASPLSMHAALETLGAIPAKRKIAVLGDMLEIGKYAPEAHEHVGAIARGIVDVLFTVGPRAKFIADAAAKAGMKHENIRSFDTADEAGKPLQAFMRAGDVILVKGSHAMELSKVIEEVKQAAAKPEGSPAH